ncbi:hypothetical protein [Candidatus Nitrotoga sp. M5]|uniref:hypothetical protein n=1 Tax=Candidatus Nitrotoga sp. M5 TaxID=2890409 RepID=UPI001EF2A5C6|nr:hypothetical protein [Candidatus Nitrotoga sp. M5]CAH1386155.1 conserved exported hypothetical protein [Candidatus Nitrotoga sp. M5]
MKKNVISLAIASCFVFGASLAQAQTAIPKQMEAPKAVPFSGTKTDTPWNCCSQYEFLGAEGERDAAGEVNAPGSKINFTQSQPYAIDPGHKNDDGNRMPDFRRATAVVGNTEPIDSKAYGAGRDVATTGNPEGTGDTLGKSHFTEKSFSNQWL